MQQLSTEYRATHNVVGKSKSACTKKKNMEACKAAGCSWVKPTQVKASKKGKSPRKAHSRKGHCKSARPNLTKLCTVCGDLLYADEWKKNKCDQCLKLSPAQLKRLQVGEGAFARYKGTLHQRGGSGDNGYGYDAVPCGSWEDLAELINILPPDPAADPESIEWDEERREEFQSNVDQITEGGDPDEQVYVALNVAQHFMDTHDDPPLGASAEEVRALNELV